MHTHSLEPWSHGHVFLGDRHDRHARRTWAVVALTAATMVVEIVGGTWYGSMALVADGWSLEWPSEIDFGAAQLRRWADEQAGEVMPAAEFRAWVEARGLTPDRAADALGLPHRTVALYLSGEQPVPKTVMLATKGYDRRAAA